MPASIATCDGAFQQVRLFLNNDPLDGDRSNDRIEVTRREGSEALHVNAIEGLFQVSELFFQELHARHG